VDLAVELDLAGFHDLLHGSAHIAQSHVCARSLCSPTTTQCSLSLDSDALHVLRGKPACTLMPALVASLTVWRSGSNLGLNATVKAQSMMRPLTCVPKSIFITSS
jgi:hypothetical protein